MDNANSREYLDKILTQVLENMKRTAHAPSVQMMDVPRDSLGLNDDDEAALDDLDEDENIDKRRTQRRADKYVQKNGELSDSEDEEMEIDGDGRPSGSRKRRAIQNYRHIMDVGGNDSGVETGSGMGTPQQASSLPDEVADEMNVDDDLERIGQPTPSPQNGEHHNGPAATSGPQSPAHNPPAVDDGDIEMGDADAPNGHILAATAAQHELPHPMEDATSTVQQQRTPPDSPPTPGDEEPSPAAANAAISESTMHEGEDESAIAVHAPHLPPATTEPEATGATAEETAIKQEVIGDDEVAKAQEEGRMERELANAEGEAKTEAMAKVEAAEGDAEATTIERPAQGEREPQAGSGAEAKQGS
jgi:histone deacetylase 1/2